MRVALFITCFNDTLLPQAGRATVQLLETGANRDGAQDRKNQKGESFT